MKAVIIYIILLLQFIFMACNEASVYPWEPIDNPTENPVDYFPLTKGSVWEYEVTIPSNPILFTLRNTVLSQYLDREKSIFEIKEVFSSKIFPEDQEAIFLIQKYDNIVNTISVNIINPISGQDGDNPMQLYLNIPLTMGKQWIYYPDDLESETTFKLVVKEYLNDVEVKAGIFDSVAVLEQYVVDEFYGNILVREIFLAPNVGLIKSIYHNAYMNTDDSTEIDLSINFELKNYNIKD